MVLDFKHIEWLNKPICTNINNWTILHVIYGMIWGFTTFNLQTFVIIHIILEVYEIHMFGNLDDNTYESADIFIDIIGGIVGWVITKTIPVVSYSVIFWFVGNLI